MELSPVPPPLFDSVQTEGIDPVRQKGLDLCIRPTRAVVISNAVLRDSIIPNLAVRLHLFVPACT
jgi:hypothetical protein